MPRKGDKFDRMAERLARGWGIYSVGTKKLAAALRKVYKKGYCDALHRMPRTSVQERP